VDASRQPRGGPGRGPVPPAIAAVAGRSLTPEQRQFVDYGRAEGHPIIPVRGADLKARLHWNDKEVREVPLTYVGREQRIYLNTDSTFWRDPIGRSARFERLGWWSTGNALGRADHEIGHARHHAALGDAYFEPKYRGAFKGDTLKKIKADVSGYAATRPVEFVAEVYSGLKAGKIYDAKILSWYSRLGGVMP
jgi:hypothetical protein